MAFTGAGETYSVKISRQNEHDTQLSSARERQESFQLENPSLAQVSSSSGGELSHSKDLLSPGGLKSLTSFLIDF